VKLRLCLLVLVLLAQVALARENYEQMPEVQQAIKAMEAGKYIQARELAEKLLKQDGRNWAACAILGRLYLYVEPGGLPRAYYYLKRARGLMRRDWGEPVDSSGPWRTQWEILQGLISTCSHMERYEEQLRILRDYNRWYRPEMPEEEGWPLMKLGRLAEARGKMEAVLASSKEERARVTAYNTLGAIELEAHNVQASRDWYARLWQEIKERGWDLECTFPRNLAEAEEMLGNYSQAEELLLESSKHPNPWAYTNPWGDLANLYIDQGRFPEVLSAIKRMEAWGATSVPIVVSQTWAERQTTTAYALYAMGYDDAAERLMRRIIYRPDRNMGTSSKAYLVEVINLGIYRGVLLARCERVREEMSWSTWTRWFELGAQLVNLTQELDQITDRTAALVVGEGGLPAGVQCHQTGSFYASWMLPDVNNLFGTGVVAAQVDRIFQDDKHTTLEVEKPYLQAVLAEGEWLGGTRERARQALEKALTDLAPSQMLLRARMEAELGDTLWRQGKRQDALGHFDKAFQLDGAMFRRLGIRLPVAVTSSGGSQASRAAGYLRNSPRFFSDSNGFKVHVTEGAAGLSATVSDFRGTRIAEVTSPAKNTSDETVRAFCARFHEYVFSARMDLSQSDINSLNGSTAATSAAREDLLKTLRIEPQSPP
jgi:tetratricopeptide (TPR) repeat protein